MRYRILLILWIVTDMLLFVGSYALAYFLRVGFIFSSSFPFDHFIVTAMEVAPVWLIVLASTRTFFLTHSQANLRSAAYMIYAGVVGISLFTIVYYFHYVQFFSRALLLTALVSQIAVLWLWHIVFDAFKRAMLRKSPPAFPTLLIGVTRETASLIKRLQERKSALLPVAILENRGTKEKEVEGVPILGKLNKLEETIQEHGITHLIQCADLEQSINLAGACREHGITYMLLPSVLGLVEGDEHIESLEGLPVTVVHPGSSMKGSFFA
jgi:FlaA1/EpsC-like NDP-sugar epimerase